MQYSICTEFNTFKVHVKNITSFYLLLFIKAQLTTMIKMSSVWITACKDMSDLGLSHTVGGLWRLCVV
jgi:hypothetical protein